MKSTRLLKKIGITILSLTLAFASTMNVRAEEPVYVYLGETDAVNNELIMQVGTSLENSIEGISYKVTLGDEELEILSVSDYKTENMQTSYALLVDVSGSIKKSEMDNIKEILRCMVNGMGENDNASIMLIGNNVYAESFTSDKEALLQSVENIDILSEDTNLFYAINQAMDVLTTSEQTLERKCIVILSDGQDDQISGITEKEVEEKINASNIPICSVAVRGNNDKAVEIAKIMGSFSRMSPGGVHMIYDVDGMDAETVAETVFGVTQNIAVLKADISGYEPNGTENYLQVEAVVEGVGSATDGYNVKSVFISEGVVEESEVETSEAVSEEMETSETVEEPEALIEEESKSDGKEDFDLGVREIIIIGIVAIMLIAIIVLIVSGKMRKKKVTLEEVPKAAKATEEAEQQVTAKPVDVVKENVEKKEIPKTGIVSNMQMEEPDRTPVLEVQLTRVGNIEKETITLVVKGELIIGRKKELADVAFEQDQQLSGKHCKLVYDGEHLSLVDLDSLNGTLVNGVPISVPYQLSRDDKFYIGSKEWRIHW